MSLRMTYEIEAARKQWKKGKSHLDAKVALADKHEAEAGYKKDTNHSPESGGGAPPLQSQHGARVKLRMAAKIAGRMAAEAQRQAGMADEVTEEADWDNFEPDNGVEGPSEEVAKAATVATSRESHPPFGG